MAVYNEGQGPQRPNSIRSVASNSSISSSVSLTRQARTRTRSRTVTERTSPRAQQDPAPGLPFLDGNFYVQEPSSNLFSNLGQPSPHLPLSPTRNTTGRVQVQDEKSEQLVQEDSSSTAGYMSAKSKPPSLILKSSQTSGLQILPTTSQPQPPPSAFSRDPSLTRINTSAVNVRDSMSTQLSGAPSSIYPPSTSTASGPDSPPSPHSATEPDTYDVSYDPEVGENQEYDGDDVSYRLRLLMKNNYFLPPAHSKPSLAALASSGLNAPKRPARPTAPAFLDLFWGKSKSKSSPPTSYPNSPLPALRTAADSITPSYALQPRISSQMPRMRSLPGIRTGRVVVVREKMYDLSIAAKQAETDMKAREARRDQLPTINPSKVVDVIDPTDTVDVPLPSSTYPFAVQASALQGLGVQDSVGAAILADRLPPPHGSGMTSSFDTEEDWRKDLLHQAVHHSLDSTSQDFSSFSLVRESSTPLASPRRDAPSREPLMTSSSIGMQILDRRIISNAGLSDTPSSPLGRRDSAHSQTSNSSTKGRPNRNLAPPDTSRQSFLPTRVETPLGDLTSLKPPPREFRINPLHSLSQTELPKHERLGETSLRTGPSPKSLRKAISSPILSDVYGDGGHTALTPPPLPTPITSNRSSLREVAGSPTFDALSHFTLDSHYSDEMAFDDARPTSLTLSAINGRPSLSEYSQPSPTRSTYDPPSHGGEYTVRRASSDRGTLSTRSDSVLRYSAMSPPPRVSSSLAYAALLPPPRNSSFRHPGLKNRASGSMQLTEPLTDDTTLPITLEPTRPLVSIPLPISDRLRNIAPGPLSLDIPAPVVPVAIHSAPGPSSPTSFFDSIQSQPNAMDDLDSSSESEDGNDESYDHPPGPVHPYADPRNRATSSSSSTRSLIMRLGNHSTPHISKAVETFPPSLPSGVQNPKRPIGNVPARTPFFTERPRRSDLGRGPPSTALDYYKVSQQHPTSIDPPGKRRSTVGSVMTWRNNQKAQESLRKLDGMLIEHMVAEKDRMKQIASTVRSNIPVSPRF